MARGDFAGRAAVDQARRALTQIEMELMSHGQDHTPDVTALQVYLSQLADALGSLEHVVETIAGA